MKLPRVYEPRQVNKRDLIRIARALGLAVSEKEKSVDIARRCVDSAQQLRRDFNLMASRYKPLKGS